MAHAIAALRLSQRRGVGERAEAPALLVADFNGFVDLRCGVVAMNFVAGEGCRGARLLPIIEPLTATT
jgi:hypothetical protein